MKCMSCLGLVVRLNSFRGFNLAHSKKGRTTICVSAEVLDRLLDLYFPHLLTELTVHSVFLTGC